MAIVNWANAKVNTPQRLVVAAGVARTLRRIHLSSPVQAEISLVVPQLTVNGGYAIATDGVGNWLIGGYDKIALSADNGATWTVKRNSVGDTCQALCMKPGVWLAVVYGAGSAKILRSTDGGTSWTVQYTASAGQTITGLAYTGTTWAATNRDANQVLYSADNGVTWNVSASTVNAPAGIAAPGAGAAWLVAASDGIYRSTNAAVTWNKISTIPTSQVLSSSVAGCVAIGAGGIYQCDDSISWQLVQQLDAMPVALATSGFDQYVVVTAAGSIWRASDNNNGKIWSRIFALPWPTQAAMSSALLLLVDASGYLYRADATVGYWNVLMDGWTFYCEAYESVDLSPDYQLAANCGIDLITPTQVAVTLLGE
ncbi:MAG: sialidase family protein [Caldilineaceae bacterium]